MRSMANLIIKSAVKEEFDGMNVATGHYDELNAEVSELVEDAARRAEENDRKRSNRVICRRLRYSVNTYYFW